MEARNEDFIIFCNGHDIKVSGAKSEQFLLLINRYSYDVVSLLFNTLDEFVECAAFVFSQGKIKAEQMATILEFRVMKQIRS